MSNDRLIVREEGTIANPIPHPKLLSAISQVLNISDAEVLQLFEQVTA